MRRGRKFQHDNFQIEYKGTSKLPQSFPFLYIVRINKNISPLLALKAPHKKNLLNAPKDDTNLEYTTLTQRKPFMRATFFQHRAYVYMILKPGLGILAPKPPWPRLRALFLLRSFVFFVSSSLHGMSGRVVLMLGQRVDSGLNGFVFVPWRGRLACF